MLSVNCNSIGFLLGILAKILFYVRIIVPILLIVMVVFDLVKVVVGQADDKAKKEATSKIVKRIVYAAIIFLVPTLINFIFLTIEKYGTRDGTATDWIGCWTQYYK